MKRNNLITEVKRIRVMMGLVENAQLADKLYFNSGKLNGEIKDAILNITGGDNYTKLVADLYYHFSKYSNNKDGIDSSLIRLVEDFYDDLTSYNNKIFPFTDNLNNFGADKPNEFHILTLAEVLKGWHELNFEWSRLPSIFKRNLTNELKNVLGIGNTSNNEMRFRYVDIAKNLRQINEILRKIPKNKLDEITPMLINSKKTLKDLLETLNNIENSLSYISVGMVDKDILLDKASGVNADVIMDTDKVVVFKINDHEAMQEMGCYTNWCFSQVGSDIHWETYAAYGYVYVIYNLTVETDDARFLMVLLPETGELYMSNNIKYNEVYYPDDSDRYLSELGVDVNKL